MKEDFILKLAFRCSRPVLHSGHSRASAPSPLSGNRKGPIAVSSSSITPWRAVTASVAGFSWLQKSRSTTFQSRSPAETSSSRVSSAAVKSYSTHWAKNCSRKAVTSRPLSSGMNRFLSMRTYSRSRRVVRIEA